MEHLWNKCILTVYLTMYMHEQSDAWIATSRISMHNPLVRSGPMRFDRIYMAAHHSLTTQINGALVSSNPLPLPTPPPSPISTCLLWILFCCFILIFKGWSLGNIFYSQQSLMLWSKVTDLPEFNLTCLQKNQCFLIHFPVVIFFLPWFDCEPTNGDNR